MLYLFFLLCHCDSSLSHFARSSGGCEQHKLFGIHLESRALYLPLCSATAIAAVRLRELPAAGRELLRPVSYLTWELDEPVLLLMEQALLEALPLVVSWAPEGGRSIWAPVRESNGRMTPEESSLKGSCS